MEYQAIAVGISPRSGLQVYRQFIDIETKTRQNRIKVIYDEWHLALDGSKILYSPDCHYWIENKPAVLDENGVVVTPAANNFDKWRTHLVASSTLEDTIVPAANQTLLQIPVA